MAALRSESSEMEKLREEGRGKRQKTEEEEKIKKVMAFFLSSGTKLSFRLKLVSLKYFELNWYYHKPLGGLWNLPILFLTQH